jgi:uncharacterized protein
VRILFDSAHPAHVHQFVTLAHALTARGHEVRFVGRDKDVTHALLEASGLPFEVPPAPPYPRGRWRDARELVLRVRALRRIVRNWRPDVLLTRNPSGALATFGTRTRSVFDTDDGRRAGLHYWLARPAADIITSSEHDPESHSRRHIRYPGFKALTYLHPTRFRPDPTIRERLSVPDGPLFVVRYSSHDASHDRRIDGIGPEAREEILTLLSAQGTVILAREGAPTIILGQHPEATLPPETFLDLLALADLCVGDSQSVAIEAALLGVPTIRLSGFSGRHFTLRIFEDAYGLIRNFLPGEESELLEAVTVAVDALGETKCRTEDARQRLLDASVDLTDWFARMVEGFSDSPEPRQSVAILQSESSRAARSERAPRGDGPGLRRDLRDRDSRPRDPRDGDGDGPGFDTLEVLVGDGDDSTDGTSQVAMRPATDHEAAPEHVNR